SMAQPGPNPQTNLIISIVLPVVALITVAALYFTKPVINALPAPTPVNTGAVALPAPGVQQANALPGAGTGAAAGGMATGGRGGPVGMGGGGGAPIGLPGPGGGGPPIGLPGPSGGRPAGR
ncbi:MAG TPA: hypothetical protein VK171_16645, partial [Fimbriimonas sp.]|nr:hypothetical protein [Fimbriimonas sp.]